MEFNNILELSSYISDKLKAGSTLESLTNIIDCYIGDDWKEFQSDNNNYRQVAYQDDNIKVMIISWAPDKVSGIHDHPMFGCILKIMQGEIVEDVYYIQADVFYHTDSNHLKANDKSFLKGTDGLHHISNCSNKYCYSLHIYSPSDYKPIYYGIPTSQGVVHENKIFRINHYVNPPSSKGN